MSLRDKEPVQAYVPKYLVQRFKARYRHHGAITQLIVKAFELATAETDKSRDASEREARRQLDDWQDRAFGHIPDPDVLASILRDAAAEEHEEDDSQ
jgi:hypothetical protein